jgi:hypothetical protein
MAGKDAHNFVDLAQQLGCHGNEHQFEALLDAVLRMAPGQDGGTTSGRNQCGRLDQPELIVEIGHPGSRRRVERERGEGREIRDGT